MEDAAPEPRGFDWMVATSFDDLACYPQLYSRIGFVHHFRSLSENELRFILAEVVEIAARASSSGRKAALLYHITL